MAKCVLSWAAAFMGKGFVDGLDKVQLRKAAVAVEAALAKHGKVLADIEPAVLGKKVSAAMVFQ